VSWIKETVQLPKNLFKKCKMCREIHNTHAPQSAGPSSPDTHANRAIPCHCPGNMTGPGLAELPKPELDHGYSIY